MKDVGGLNKNSSYTLQRNSLINDNDTKKWNSNNQLKFRKDTPFKMNNTKNRFKFIKKYEKKKQTPCKHAGFEKQKKGRGRFFSSFSKPACLQGFCSNGAKTL